MSARLFSGASALADVNLLDNLSGTWESLDNFVTVNQCITAPSEAGLYLCSPAQLATFKHERFEMGGMLSATNSVISIADTLRKNEIDSSEINSLFSSYNYSELLLNARLDYVAPRLLVGVRPFRIQGQFQVHNPNLPLGSLTYREDLTFFAGTGFQLKIGEVALSLGATGSLISRTETLSEASLIDFGSKSSDELLFTQKQFGTFADVGATAELPAVVSTSLLLQDLGKFWNGVDTSSRYLFIHYDKKPRFTYSVAAIPKLWVGNLQIGLSLVGFFDEANSWSDQWFGTLSYYVGPLKILSGIRPDLLRTGVGLNFSNFQVSVAQEWINQLETGRQSQPRFTIEVSAGL